jgi:hypothetical protein
MDEAWYIVEQQIRERHAEAREAARIQALTQDPATTIGARTPLGSRSVVWRSGFLVRAMPFPLKLSPMLANVRPATNRCELQREKGHHHGLRGHRMRVRPST